MEEHNMNIDMKDKSIDLDNKILEYEENGDVKVILKNEIPTYLYKYYATNDRNIQNLLDNKIHFAHPYTLNDVMDGNFMLFDTDSFVEEYNKEMKREVVSKLEGMNFFKPIFEEFYKYRGVLCLSKTYDNDLFWPHYTSEQGFCIEFKTDKFVNSFEKSSYDVLPITYLEELSQIEIKKHIIKTTENIIENGLVILRNTVNMNIPILYALSVKSKIWSYEEEWRIVLKSNDFESVNHSLDIMKDEEYLKECNGLKKRNIPFDKSSISKIILAPLFFSKSRFNHREEDKSKNEIAFYFSSRNDNVNFIAFFRELKSHYNDKIFQLDKVFNSDKNLIQRVLNYKIEIIEVNNCFVKIKRTKT